jgi:hypothetical protein
MPFSFPEGAMAEGNRDREEGPEKFDKQMIRAVRRVLQQELQEIRDLLVSLTENQRGIIERNQSEQSEPKLAVSLPRLSTPGNPRSARPCFSPQGTRVPAKQSFWYKLIKMETTVSYNCLFVVVSMLIPLFRRSPGGRLLC